MPPSFVARFCHSKVGEHILHILFFSFCCCWVIIYLCILTRRSSFVFARQQKHVAWLSSSWRRSSLQERKNLRGRRPGGRRRRMVDVQEKAWTARRTGSESDSRRKRFVWQLKRRFSVSLFAHVSQSGMVWLLIWADCGLGRMRGGRAPRTGPAGNRTFCLPTSFMVA